MAFRKRRFSLKPYIFIFLNQKSCWVCLLVAATTVYSGKQMEHRKAMNIGPNPVCSMDKSNLVNIVQGTAEWSVVTQGGHPLTNIWMTLWFLLQSQYLLLPTNQCWGKKPKRNQILHSLLSETYTHTYAKNAYFISLCHRQVLSWYPSTPQGFLHF